MLFIWLTICNKKGTVRDLCTIPLSSIIYYTIMKKISTTTYFHPILWHRIHCIFRHRHSPYMLPDLPHIPALLLRHGVWFRPVPEYSCNFHHIQMHNDMLPISVSSLSVPKSLPHLLHTLCSSYFGSSYAAFTTFVS